MALVPANTNLSEKSEVRSSFTSACRAAAEALEKGDFPQSSKAQATQAIDAAQTWIKANPTAAAAMMQEKLKEMQRVVDPVVTKGKLDAYCKDISASLSTKNFEASEKADIEKALAACDVSSGKPEELEASYKTLQDAVNPIMIQANKRAGSVSGQMVHLKNGGYYFQADEQPSKARLLLEDVTGVVFVDLDESADDNSLACIVEDLQARTQRNLTNKMIVLTIDARANHPAMHRHLIRSGAFMVGLRATSLPVIGVMSGRCAGPAWNLLLGCDYRIAVLGTVFHLPICSGPQCIQTIVGPATSTELCMSTSVLDCHALLELGILNEGRPTFEEAKYSAYELAKRTALFPHIGLRQTIVLLNPAAQAYTNAVAEDPSLMIQVYPDDDVK